MQEHRVSQCSSLTWRFGGDYGGVAALPIVNLSALQPQVQDQSSISGYLHSNIFTRRWSPKALLHLHKIIPFSAEILLQGHLWPKQIANSII